MVNACDAALIIRRQSSINTWNPLNLTTNPRGTSHVLKIMTIVQRIPCNFYYSTCSDAFRGWFSPYRMCYWARKVRFQSPVNFNFNEAIAIKCWLLISYYATPPSFCAGTIWLGLSHSIDYSTTSERLRRRTATQNTARRYAIDRRQKFLWANRHSFGLGFGEIFRHQRLLTWYLNEALCP